MLYIVAVSFICYKKPDYKDRNHLRAANRCQTISHNAISSTLHQCAGIELSTLEVKCTDRRSKSNYPIRSRPRRLFKQKDWITFGHSSLLRYLKCQHVHSL